jgi:hypothetical protein
MADFPIPHIARRVTREELYALVWQRPMSRLAEEFGISGNGLAKICDNLDVPYPPRSYWAKKEAGKPVVTFKLPPRKDGVPQAADVHPTPLKPATLPKTEKPATAATVKVEGIVVADGLDDAHPRVPSLSSHASSTSRSNGSPVRRDRTTPKVLKMPRI